MNELMGRPGSSSRLVSAPINQKGTARRENQNEEYQRRAAIRGNTIRRLLSNWEAATSRTHSHSGYQSTSTRPSGTRRDPALSFDPSSLDFAEHSSPRQRATRAREFVTRVVQQMIRRPCVVSGWQVKLALRQDELDNRQTKLGTEYGAPAVGGSRSSRRDVGPRSWVQRQSCRRSPISSPRARSLAAMISAWLS
jgi:hypothetical protein